MGVGEILVKEPGFALLDVLPISPERGFDHLFRPVDGCNLSRFEALADERDKGTVAAADLQQSVIRRDVHDLGRPNESF